MHLMNVPMPLVILLTLFLTLPPLSMILTSIDLPRMTKLCTYAESIPFAYSVMNLLVRNRTVKAVKESGHL